MKKFLQKIIWKIKQFPNAIRNTFLCWRFPFLRSQGWEDKPTFKFLQWYSWYGCIPRGWRKAFGIQLCKELKAELKRCGYLRKYRITDIKEKYGQLTIYDCGVPKNCDVHDILHKYEYISYRTCIECGRIAKYITTGWICPYCEDCISENRRDVAEKFYSDIPFYGWTNNEYYEKHKKDKNKEIE